MSKEPSAFHKWLNKLSEHNINYFLEGGQAVNIWAYRFLENTPNLRNYLPFTSKDCDIWIDSDGFKKISGVLDGYLKKSNSPLDGQLGIITSKDNDLVLDLFQDVFGLNNNELKKCIYRCLDLHGIKVIDPIYLFKGKCHNLTNLPQADRNDAKHLLMLSIIIPEYIKAYLAALCAEEFTDPKELKNELKLLLSFQKDKYVRQAMKTLELTFLTLIPLDELYECENEPIRKYAHGYLNRFFNKSSQ